MSKSFAAIFCIAALLNFGCKTGGPSQGDAQVKDAVLSPADLSKPYVVIWQTADNNVHYGTCPSTAAAANHNCINITEKFVPLKLDTYKDRLKVALVNDRPAGSTSSTQALTPQAQLLQDKIKRLTDKINAGGLSTQTAATFNTQLAQLKAEFAKASATLSTSEQQVFDSILLALQNSKDVTYDEGEHGFDLAASAFTAAGNQNTAINCQSGGQFVGNACWYLGVAGQSCDQTCTGKTLQTSDETINYAGSAGSDANCILVATTFGHNFSLNSSAQSQAVGCFYYQPSPGLYRYTGVVTTHAAATGGFQRYCACK